MTVVADSGALYALMDRSDAWHERVVEWWESRESDVVVPITVLPEVTFLLQKRCGPAAEELFARSVAEHEFEIEHLEHEDLIRAPDLMREYADLPLGFVDATVVALSERLFTRDILTTDRRHFSLTRPRHTRSFRLLP